MLPLEQWTTERDFALKVRDSLQNAKRKWKHPNDLLKQIGVQFLCFTFDGLATNKLEKNGGQIEKFTQTKQTPRERPTAQATLNDNWFEIRFFFALDQRTVFMDFVSLTTKNHTHRHRRNIVHSNRFNSIWINRPNAPQTLHSDSIDWQAGFASISILLIVCPNIAFCLK